MKNFFLLALAGVIAQLVDGSLAWLMGYRPPRCLWLLASHRLWHRRAYTSLRLGPRRFRGFRTPASATWTGPRLCGSPSLVGLGRYWERCFWYGHPRWRRRRATSSRRSTCSYT